MCKLKHTPGPWDYSGFCKLDNSIHVGTIGKHGTTGIHFTKNTSCKELVADVWTNEADARLIAAAPEMLEYLIFSHKGGYHGNRLVEIIEKATGMKIEDVGK